jgi:hypothetical protein
VSVHALASLDLTDCSKVTGEGVIVDRETAAS